MRLPHDSGALSARRIDAIALAVAGIIDIIAAGFTATKLEETAITDVTSKVAYGSLLTNAPPVFVVDLPGMVTLIDCIFAFKMSSMKP
ncbi:hypothetical protein [Rhizobium sp. BR 314]|uniref:hypothetical protein n=1 Tax=Rhizobium sp. BR 314 TaxID=3040013 RepID=UPI0039BF1437